jgi:hypothetical protein
MSRAGPATTTTPHEQGRGATVPGGPRTRRYRRFATVNGSAATARLPVTSAAATSSR